MGKISKQLHSLSLERSFNRNRESANKFMSWDRDIEFKRNDNSSIFQQRTALKSLTLLTTFNDVNANVI